jgi:hypothetical protein
LQVGHLNRICGKPTFDFGMLAAEQGLDHSMAPVVSCVHFWSVCDWAEFLFA